jgi:Zn-dependent protease with chaperone function
MAASRGPGRDFFQAQDDARSATRWFLLLFAACLILIVSCVYLAVTAGYFVYEHVSDGAPYETPLFDLKRAIVTVNATIWCIALAGLYKYARLARGGSYVCESLGARRVDPTTRSRLERRLLNVVEEMAIASGVPLPAVHVLDGEPGINAFAAGYEIDRAAIAVTHGALENLDRDELQAVVAHEFSHILNGDMRLNTRLIAALHGILALTIVGRALRYLVFPRKSVSGASSGGIWSSSSGSRVRSASNRKGSGNAAALILAVLVVVVLITAIGAIGAFFARLIQAAVCRQRELLADAAAVQFTRQPDKVASALKRVSASGSLLNVPDAASVAHLCFGEGVKSFVAQTHPPLGDRIRQHDPLWDGRAPAPNQQDLGGLSDDPPAALLALAGTLRQPSLDYARAMLASIPESVRSALQHPTRALALVIWLLLDDDPAQRDGRWEMVRQSFAPEVLQAVHELAPQLSAFGQGYRMPLIELALPALRTLPDPLLLAFGQTIDRLILSDNRTEFFEFIVQRSLRERLGPLYAETARRSSRFTPAESDLRRAAAVALSAMAAAGCDDLERRRRLLTTASFDAGYDPPLAYAGGDDTDFAAVHWALDALQRGPLLARRRFLDASERTICADGEVTLREAELFRAVALSLGVPVPPLDPARIPATQCR